MDVKDFLARLDPQPSAQPRFPTSLLEIGEANAVQHEIYAGFSEPFQERMLSADVVEKVGQWAVVLDGLRVEREARNSLNINCRRRDFRFRAATKRVAGTSPGQANGVASGATFRIRAEKCPRHENRNRYKYSGLFSEAV